jgi:putative glutathione S-transferase
MFGDLKLPMNRRTCKLIHS